MAFMYIESFVARGIGVGKSEKEKAETNTGGKITNNKSSKGDTRIEGSAAGSADSAEGPGWKVTAASILQEYLIR